jgi:hypothetical protein
MKVKEIIDLKVAGLREAGFEPRFLILTARALDLLMREIHLEQGEAAAAALAMASPTVTYLGMEVVVADLGRLEPVTVSGTVRDEMDLYNLKVKG